MSPLTAVVTEAAGTSWMVSRAGDIVPPFGNGPAPPWIVAPRAGMLVFQSILKLYVTPWVSGTTACTAAAFGE